MRVVRSHKSTAFMTSVYANTGQSQCGDTVPRYLTTSACQQSLMERYVICQCCIWYQCHSLLLAGRRKNIFKLLCSLNVRGVISFLIHSHLWTCSDCLSTVWSQYVLKFHDAISSGLWGDKHETNKQSQTLLKAVPPLVLNQSSRLRV